jgi:predicted GIY-YIG superfamily endonuclease
VVYLLHFSLPYHHTQHYIGFSTQLQKRLGHHFNGSGSPFVHAVSQSGRKVVVARIWPRARQEFERSLKNRKKAHVFCPICCDDAMTRGKSKRASPRYGIIPAWLSNTNK